MKQQQLSKVKKSMSNKGFSMVELIIVIAIMVTLVAVTAPQFMKFLESSKESADAVNIKMVMTTLKTTLADPDTGSISASQITLDGETGLITGTVATKMYKFLGTGTTVKLTSELYAGTGADTTIKFNYNGDGVVTSVSLTGTFGAETEVAYETILNTEVTMPKVGP